MFLCLFLLAFVSLAQASEGVAATVREPIIIDHKKLMKESQEQIDRALSAQLKYKRSVIDDYLHQADVALKLRDFRRAEELYLGVLTYKIPLERRREVLLDMVDLYEVSGEMAKQAAVLEKFLDFFEGDDSVPQVFIKLGLIYRDMGLYKLALTRFYSVLNYALRIEKNEIEAYKLLSIRAQLEIADTHFQMAEYRDAISFYEKLRLLDITEEDRAYIVFQIAYSYSLLQDNAKAISGLEGFIKAYPEHEFYAEAIFLLSNTYSRMGRIYEASSMVLKLLKSQKKEGNPQWEYWQKKAGNQLANDFFAQGDYASALTIYQSLKELSSSASWQWPILYQIGLCFENLKVKPKAKTAYEEIINWRNDGREAQRDTALEDRTLKSLYEMAQWRLDNIDWDEETSKELEKLLDKS